MKRTVAFSPSTGLKMTKQKVNETMSKLSLFDPNGDKENFPGYANGVLEVPVDDQKHPLAGLVVEVEGNLGSGKSTLLKKLRQYVKEQTGDDEFCTVFGEIINDDFLKAFYGSPKQYGFAFQMYMLTTRLYQIDESARQSKSEGKVTFLDRGAVGDTLFALLSNKLGNMSDKDMDIYRSVCRQRMPATLSDKVDVLMYLDVDPHECHRRVTTVRNTEAEEGLPLAYLDSVDDCYFHLLMDWIGSRKGGYHEMNIGPPPKMVVVRWNNFGETADAVSILQDAVENKRRAPTIQFTKYAPENHPYLTLATQQAIHDTFAILQGLDDELKSSGHCSTTRTCSDSSVGSLVSIESADEDRVLREVDTVVIDWGLEHSNAFRRVVMYHLSLGSHIIFYNDDLQ